MSQTSTLTKNGNSPVALNRRIPSSANLSDAMGLLGYKFQTLHNRIRPITNVPVWGPAYTVQCYPGATYGVEEALEKAAPGDVLVIDGEGYTGAVLMGGLMSGRARQRGLAGAIIDGAVRDVEELQKHRWPVYAAGITPRSGTFAKLGQLGISVSCGNVVIQPGDMIVGDADGVVAIPAAILDEALEAAWEIEQKENFIAAALENGLSLPEAVQEYKTRPS